MKTKRLENNLQSQKVKIKHIIPLILQVLIQGLSI